MATWVEQTGSTPITNVVQSLGLTAGKNRSFGPCPKCGASQRAADDRRMPLGVTADGKGWQCWIGSCRVEGDLVDFVSYQIHGVRFRDLTEGEKRASVKKECLERGYWVESNPHGISEVDLAIRRKGPTSGPTAPLIATPEPDADPATTGNFAWRETLAYGAFNALWGDPDALPVLDFLRNVRKFSDEVIKSWGLGAMVIKRSGKVVERWLVIPLSDPNGVPINARFRSIPGPCLYCSTDGLANGPGCSKCKKKKNEPGTVPRSYRVCADRPLPLFGRLDASGGAVIITEGELDVIALDEYGWRSNVVSGTAGGQQEWPDEWLDRLEPYATFTLATDQDKVGNEAALKIAAKLGKYRCARAALPLKDAGECLASGTTLAAVRAALDNAESMAGIQLVGPDELAGDIENLISNPTQLIGLQSGLPTVNEVYGGLQPGLHIFTGETGEGKTSFATFLCWDLATLGHPCLVTSFEMEPVGSAMILLQMEMGGDFRKHTAAERMTALQAVRAKGVRIANKYGDVSDEEIIDTVRYARRRRGIRVALIDHLDFVVRVRKKGEDEREAKERVIRDLATIGVQDDIVIFLIVHPNNQAQVQQRRVQMGDLKGASAIRQDAHSVVIVEKLESSATRPFPASMLHFDKIRNRFGIGSGARRLLAFDPLSGHFAQNWESTPSGRAGITVAVP